MKRYGDPGKGMQFTSAKRGSEQKKPYPNAHDNPPGVPAPYHQSGTGLDKPTEKLVRNTGQPQRERIRDGACIDATYGRGANDGFKKSPRGKVW